MKTTYISPVVDYCPMILGSRICSESFFDPLNIGDPANAGNGR